MTRAALLALTALLIATAAPAHDAPEPLSGFPQVLVETTHGEFVIELEASRAPLTAAHFAALVRSGHYDGTIFHRVVAGFVVQGGGYTADYEDAGSAGTVVNESGNGLSNTRGTVAMARTEDPHSADAQFYVNVKDNTALDPRPDRWGYTVFGRVYSGMETIERIASLPTGPGGPFAKEVPAMPVVVRAMRILTDAEIAERAAAELEAAQRELEAVQQP